MKGKSLARSIARVTERERADIALVPFTSPRPEAPKCKA